jgi:hypothetical protein
LTVGPSTLKSPVRFPTEVRFNSEVEGVIADDIDVTPESM